MSSPQGCVRILGGLSHFLTLKRVVRNCLVDESQGLWNEAA